MPNEVTVPLDFQPILLHFFLIKFGNKQGLNKAGMKADVASRRVEAKKEERSWSQGGQVTNLDLLESSRKHMVFQIWSMALTSRPDNYPHHKTWDQP